MSILNELIDRCTTFPDDILIKDGPATDARTFLELVRKLAAVLRENGIAAGDRVALALPQGVNFTVAAAASWLSGASFVPINEADPPHRLSEILSSSRARAVIAERPLTVPGISAMASEMLIFQGKVRTIGGISTTSPPVRSAPQGEAYVIFTSGSTGSPKGVSVGHDAIESYIRYAGKRFRVPITGMAFPAQLPPTFDASLVSLLLPMVTRNTIFPLRDDNSSTRVLAEFLRTHEGPAFVKATPSQVALLRQMLDEPQVESLDATFLIGGEPLDFAQVSWLRRNNDVALFNQYGPTETTVACLCYEIGQDDPGSGPVPIGFPVPGTSLTVGGRPWSGQRTGPGELAVSGVCVANGYLGSDGHLQSFGGYGQRRFDTGDVVETDSRGFLRFVGRNDNQYKINGYRVNVGEIEAALTVLSGGRPAAATVVDGRLLAVLSSPNLPDLDVIVSRAHAMLPAYMVPEEIIIDTVPLTANGKIDRPRLSELAAEHIQSPTVALTPTADRKSPPAATGVDMRTPEETQLTNVVAIICDAVSTITGARVAPSDDFIAAGMQSLNLLRLQSAIFARWDVSLTALDLYDHPTAEALAKHVLAVAATQTE